MQGPSGPAAWAGACTVPHYSLRPNMIPGPKWVCCMYDFESCQGISASPEEEVQPAVEGKQAAAPHCSCVVVK